ncbi:MAG: CmpA/NrtA family ABC transporter substrate-binding protein [Pseudomonadota bacterium]|uniref:CmpA/NrtA family ABC transporter substrate-binding protein n=1 Tax=unclassified Phenylobacterium TaxID=2640670 RepID=UPI0006F74E4E|nr:MULTISPECIES: CmpA/NrtA family ABC transporter substrate-binding protein [unclassified Phenylobacterium]KRB41719.1 bicarbonate-binding protein [Phenylobacterium sp. Root700]MBT9474033.1 ABC transporter substrate-binding protein [Phenylobacterium sp.]
MTDKTLTRRTALTAAAATLVAAKAALPSGAFAAGAGPEIAKAKLGFIALTDASPLIIAKERGLFAKYGMPDVEVLKQASWAATRDNLVLGSGGGGIDGAHILSPMPYLLTTGAISGGKPVPMNILARLNTNGQAISVGNDLKAVKVGLSSAGAKAKFAQLKAAGNTAKVAMTFRGGTHDLWIRYWLAAGGINPETEVSTIVIPPPQMVANMKAGTQDAFCVGEPWNGQLVNQKVGYTACLTSEIWMNHPEKALGMRADWVAKYPRAAQAITAAVLEAQMWCDKPSNKPAMCSIVSGRQYINVPIGDILPRLQGTINYGDGRALKGSGHVMKFWADNASFPFKSHDLWFLTENQRWGVLPQSLNKTALIAKVNRADIWRTAAKSIGAAAPASDSRGPERFFDGKVFDPANPAAYLASQPIKKLV